MATIKIRNNPNASYDYLYLAVDDIRTEGIVDITGGPYVFQSVQEDFKVVEKTVTVSMVEHGTVNTLNSDHSIVSITGDKIDGWLFDSEADDSTSSILFELGNQISILGTNAGFVVDRASATVLLYSTLAGSEFKGAVLALDLDSPQFSLLDASLTIGMGAEQHRDYFLADTDIYRYVKDTAALRLADGTITTIIDSCLTADYLYQSSTQRIDVTDSCIVLTGGGIGSISANSSIYYRFAEGDDVHSGYYAWKGNWGETVYTKTLEVQTSQTHYYTFDGDTPTDEGTISDCALPNTFENVASKGGIELTNSTMTVDVVRNMSSVSGTLGGIVLNNSTLNVTSFIENSGTIAATNGSTVHVTGSVFNDNASIAVMDSTFTASAVSVGSYDTFSVSGMSTLNIGNLSGTIQLDGTTLKDSDITGGNIAVSGTILVNNSTIGSNTIITFASSTDGAIFAGANTLNGVMLDAATNPITNNGTLTVKGTSTLKIGNLYGSGTIKLNNSTIKDSSILNGSGTLLVDEGNSAMFYTTGSNTNSLANLSISNNGTITANGTMTSGAISNSSTINVTDSNFSAASVTNNAGATITVTNSAFIVSGTVTNNATVSDGPIGGLISVTDSTFAAQALSIDIYDTFSLAGESTLNIGTLTGTIQLEDGAIIKDSILAFGGTLSIAEGKSATFSTGTYTNHMEKTSISNAGTITVQNTLISGTIMNAGSILLDMNSLLTAESIDNTSGTITIDASAYTSDTHGEVKLIDVNSIGNFSLSNVGIKEGSLRDGAWLIQKTSGDDAGDVFIFDSDSLYVNSAWSGKEYGEKIGDCLYFGINAFSSTKEAADVAAKIGMPINVENGTYTEITELRGVKTTIQKGGTTEFTQAVYGGTKVTDGSSVTMNTDVSIETGTFDKFFVGGNNIAMPDTDTSYTVTASDGKKQTVAISGGVFNAIVAAGDRVQKGAFTLNSDLEMNISGGQFNYFVAGGLLNSLYENTSEVEKTNGTADIYGDISLNITGGVFADNCWIYGGCVSTSRSVSSYASTIYGDVTVTVDCGDDNAIQLSHLVAGSHGLGQILENPTTHSGGNTAIVFKGNGTNLNFTDDGELWGGSGRDNLSPITGKCTESLVASDRLLSFEGFTGDLNCKKIRDFSSIQLLDESEVGLTETTVDLKGVENWTFEYDSSLSGNFGNDFAGDTLNLTGLDDVSFDDWNILTNSSATAFKGFGSFSSVSFGTGEGSEASYSSGSDVWYNADYVLYCSEDSMLLIKNDAYVARFGSIA